MEELIKAFLKVLKDDPYSVIKDIIKSMRTILLIIISTFMYKYFVSDFVIITTLSQLANFFLSGFFLMPLLVFIITWLIFDVVLNIIMSLFFNILIVNKCKKIAAEANKSLSELNKDEKVDKSKEYTLFKNDFVRRLFFFREVSNDDIKEVESLMDDSFLSKIDVISIISIQIIIVICLLGKGNVYSIVGLTILVILFQLLKSLLFIGIAVKDGMKIN